MSAYELTFPQVPKRRADGRFTKGFKPHNKGKKWSEWMSEEGQKKVLASQKHYGRKDIGGCNKKEIIMTDSNGKEWYFESAVKCAEKIGGYPTNICKCCHGKRKTHKGFTFRYL